METELGKALEIAKSQYDAHCKKILSNKQILARILIGVTNEYKDLSVNEVMSLIEGEPDISSVPVEPGLSNMENIIGSNTEDNVPKEGVIYYDIRYSVALPKGKGQTRVIVNIEAQKSPYTGYSIVTRGMFYSARMLSAQLGTEFEKSDYGSLKKVFSIWICFNSPAKYGNSITRYSVKPENILGDVTAQKVDYDKLEVIQICLNEEDAKANELTDMLNACFSDRDAESKKDILTKKFGMVIDDGFGKEVIDMCNLSEAVYERGILKGEIKGKIEGKIEGKMEKARDIALKLSDRGMSISDVSSILEVSEKQVEEWLSEAVSLA